MQPINYTTHVQSPIASAMQGFQGGMAIRQAQQQDQLQQQQIAEAEAQKQAARQMQSELVSVSQNPNAGPREISALMLKYPQLAEKLKIPFQSMTDDQKRGRMAFASQVYAANLSGSNDVAAKLIEERKAALQASGGPDSEVKNLDNWLAALKTNPVAARNFTATMLAAEDPEKFAETFSKLSPAAQDKASADARKSGAEATTAEVGAKYAEEKIVGDLKLNRAQVEHLFADTAIKRENARIAAINVAISREGNDLKRKELQLKVEEAITARDTKVRERVSEYQSAQATLQDTFNLLTDIKADPDTLSAATGAGAWRGKVPGSKSRAMAGKIEQLQNTLAAANLDKLKGAMSDKDIMFLKNIASNLDPYQDEASFKEQLEKIEGTVIRAEKQLRAKFGPLAKDAPTAEPTPKPAADGGAPRNVVVDW